MKYSLEVLSFLSGSMYSQRKEKKPTNFSLLGEKVKRETVYFAEKQQEKG